MNTTTNGAAAPTNDTERAPTRKAYELVEELTNIREDLDGDLAAVTLAVQDLIADVEAGPGRRATELLDCISERLRRARFNSHTIALIVDRELRHLVEGQHGGVS